MWDKNENKQNEAGFGPFKKIGRDKKLYEFNFCWIR